MPTRPANHLTLSGRGLTAVVSEGLDGQPFANVEVDGERIPDPVLSTTEHGLEVTATVSAIPDDQTVYLRITIPRVAISENPESDGSVPLAAIALVSVARTGLSPDLLEGVLNEYEIRPLVGVASAVETLGRSS